jgi:hypothetical protein
MECSFALTGKGYVIVAADTTAARSIVKMKIDEDKIKTLSPHLLMAYSGEPGLFRPATLAHGIDTDNSPQGTQSNSPNLSNVTSVSTKSATSTPSVRQLLRPGSVGLSQRVCDLGNLIP